MKVTYNSPLDKFGPCCPEQLFQSIPEPVCALDILDQAKLLNQRAKGVAGLLSTGSDGSSFYLNHGDVMNSVDALVGILDQLAAVLAHPAQKPESKQP